MKKKYLIHKDDWKEIQNLSVMHKIMPQTIIFFTFFKTIQNWEDLSVENLEIAYKSSQNPGKEFILSEKQIVNNYIEACKNIEKQINSTQGKNNEQTEIQNNQPSVIFIYNNHEKQKENTSKTFNIKCSAIPQNENLEITWDIAENARQAKAIKDIINAHIKLIQWLKHNQTIEIPELLPESQKEVRNNINNTNADIPEELLHKNFFEKAGINPGKTALTWNENGVKQTLTYGELSEKALKLAAFLIRQNIKQEELIAVTLPKGPNQIIAVLGILAAGGAYLPIAVDQPEERKSTILKIAGVKYLICHKLPEQTNKNNTGIKLIAINESGKETPLKSPLITNPEKLAYVIFTSGSTGEPKGVEITHKAAYNTIHNINSKFNLSAEDKALAISALDFDLSVYDIFGLLSVGGAVVLLQENERKEASVWLKLIEQHKITIWNTVPALFDMLLIAASQKNNINSLKTILLSGDWVGLDLLERLKKHNVNAKLIALGGATEASIWSNYFELKEVNPQWNSIPYGKPLANQKFRIVNKMGNDCPDSVIGELWIGGKGVARGYLGKQELTAKSFVYYKGEKWYKTGDIGKYWPNGIIEFIGRKDQQVKIRGYRIELGEIEVALKKYKGIKQSVAAVISNGKTQHLVAGVIPSHLQNNTQKQVANNKNQSNTNPVPFEKVQKIIVAGFLAELLQMENIEYLGEKWNPVKGLNLASEHVPVVQMWLKWLENNGLILKEQDKILPTPSMKEIMKKEKFALHNLLEELTQNEKTNLVDIQHSLLEAKNHYLDILKGTTSEISLLNHEKLSPEYLSAIDLGTIKGIHEIADKINNFAGITNRPLELAILGGRTGLVAEKLLELIPSGKINITVIDSALSMVQAATERLKTSSHSLSCIQIPENDIPDQYRYHFDILVGVNIFHRYPVTEQGLLSARLMLNSKGTLLALEHYKLAPVALVTSAVLDRAFSHFDNERRQKADPMLNGNKWIENLNNSGFINAQYKNIPGSNTNLIQAECPADIIKINPDKIIQFTAQLLPAHMVPEKIKIIPWLPLTPNGKIDRKTFVAGFTTQTENMEHEIPVKGIEMEIAKIWEELLNIKQIGRNSIFFQIGGDSLLATRFLTIIKEKYGVEISLREIFETTLTNIAKQIENKHTVEQPELMEEGEI